jgi:hypothetical protein
MSSLGPRPILANHLSRFERTKPMFLCAFAQTSRSPRSDQPSTHMAMRIHRPSSPIVRSAVQPHALSHVPLAHHVSSTRPPSTGQHRCSLCAHPQRIIITSESKHPERTALPPFRWPTARSRPLTSDPTALARAAGPAWRRCGDKKARPSEASRTSQKLEQPPGLRRKVRHHLFPRLRSTRVSVASRQASLPSSPLGLGRASLPIRGDLWSALSVIYSSARRSIPVVTFYFDCLVGRRDIEFVYIGAYCIW